MPVRREETKVDIQRANQLGNAIREVVTLADASDAEMLAAIALCWFDMYGYVAYVLEKNLDINAELIWFLKTVTQLIGEAVESRYGAH